MAWLLWSSGYATSGSIERAWFGLLVSCSSAVLAGSVVWLARAHHPVAASLLLACTIAGLAIGGMWAWIYADQAPSLGQRGPYGGAPIPWFGGVLNSHWASGAGSIIGAMVGIALAIVVIVLRRRRGRRR